MMLTISSKITNVSGGRNNMEYTEKASFNGLTLPAEAVMVKIPKSEYDLLIEIKNKFLKS